MAEVSYRLDRYSNQAEALPTLLALAPIALFIAAILPEGLSLRGLFLKFSPLLALAALSFVASQIGADFGRRLEKRLWAKWDGPPTTRFLRHRNREYNQMTRRAVHGSLIGLGLQVPTEEEEDQDPELADEHFAACTAELRRLTRDKRTFGLVHKRLIDYGFRRNILGLRWIGLTIATAVSFLSALHIWWNWDAAGLNGTLLVVGIVCIGVGLGWITLVNEKAVSLGAERYANSLLETARDMER